MPEWTFGDRIRKIRRELRLNQVEFADAIGRGDKAVAAWESGTNAPEDIVSVAKRIQVRFGVSAAWVLGIDPPPPAGPGSTVRARRDSNSQPSDPKVWVSPLRSVA